MLALANKEALLNTSEQMDRETRRRRVVIFGLSVPEEDMLFPFHPDHEVADLFGAIGVPEHFHFASQRILLRNTTDPSRCAMI